MELWILITSVIVLLFLIDDLFIDGISLVYKLGPNDDFATIDVSSSKKKLAIMVANWKEYDVIGSMVKANQPLLKDGSVHLFLGVYPNDIKTRDMAQKLAAEYQGVHCVVNHFEGPTYKGQMLDEIIDGIMEWENENSELFDGFILHDSEDLIDKNSIDLYKYFIEDFDFIQTPVLSFPLKATDFVGATYLDEFAESHSKDMLVRQKMGAAIPSAGVGTCMRRNLVLYFKSIQNGKLFPHKDLTEDYILGLRSQVYNFKSKFACYNSLKGELIATREFFPNGFRASVRQKSRWTLGIVFQGWQRLGWYGNTVQRYFLWRDRKAAIAPLHTLNCLLITALLWLSPLDKMESFSSSLLIINIGMIILRLVMRSYWVHYHYGLKEALLTPLRWPLAITINTLAGLVAYKDFILQNLFGAEVKWKKTQHRFIQPPITINQEKVGS